MLSTYTVFLFTQIISRPLYFRRYQFSIICVYVDGFRVFQNGREAWMAFGGCVKKLNMWGVLNCKSMKLSVHSLCHGWLNIFKVLMNGLNEHMANMWLYDKLWEYLFFVRFHKFNLKLSVIGFFVFEISLKGDILWEVAKKNNMWKKIQN